MTSVIVASSGGDYTSLPTAEGAEQTDLTGTGVFSFLMRAFTETDVETVVSGWTTTSSDYIEIVADSGHEHFGVEGASYVGSESTAGIAALTISEDFVRVSGIELVHTAGSGTASRCITITGVTAASLLQIDSCLLHGAFGYTINNGDGDAEIWHINNACYNGGTDCRHIWAGPSTDHTYYNACEGGDTQGIGNADDVIGNICIDNGTDYSGCTAGGSGNGYNISGDTSAPGTTVNTSETATDYWASVGSDYRLKDGATPAADYCAEGFLTDVGSTNITWDFAGNTRASTSDSGCHEFTAAASPGVGYRGVGRGIGRGVARGM